MNKPDQSFQVSLQRDHLLPKPANLENVSEKETNQSLMLQRRRKENEAAGAGTSKGALQNRRTDTLHSSQKCYLS